MWRQHTVGIFPLMETGGIVDLYRNPRPDLVKQRWPLYFLPANESFATVAATVTAIRHLFAQADIAELKRGGEVEVRVVAVPNDFVPPKAGVFIKETMNALADLGERRGADPASWRTEAP